MALWCKSGEKPICCLLWALGCSRLLRLLIKAHTPLEGGRRDSSTPATKTLAPGWKPSPGTPVQLTDELEFGKAPRDKLMRTDTCREPLPVPAKSNQTITFDPTGLCTPSQRDPLEIQKGLDYANFKCHAWKEIAIYS